MADRSRLNVVARYIRCASKVVGREAMSIPQATAVEHETRPTFVVHPLFGSEGIDITQQIVEAIARELWKKRGGNDLLNWLEAERLFAETMRGLAREEGRFRLRRAAGLRHRSARQRRRTHARNPLTASTNEARSELLRGVKAAANA